MPAIIRYLTHPDVAVDPAIPPSEWSLNDAGRSRMQALAATGWPHGTAHIVASAEPKAAEAAAILAAPLGLVPEIRPGMHENDRSATGYLPGPEFEATADAFFADPHSSIRGWERAIDAQARIVAEVADLAANGPPGDMLILGHGAVGTLLICHLARIQISRAHDQPATGGGNVFAFERAAGTLLCRWQAPGQTG